jgi:hypothetical protein
LENKNIKEPLAFGGTFLATLFHGENGQGGVVTQCRIPFSPMGPLGLCRQQLGHILPLATDNNVANAAL